MFNRQPDSIADKAAQNGKQVRKVTKRTTKQTQQQLRDIQRQAKSTRRDWILRLNSLAHDLRFEVEHLQQ